MLVYLIAVNLFAFFLYGIDKRKARKGSFRVSEKYLLFVASLGGATGAFMGMRLFRHKVRKMKFALGVPLFMFIQWGVIYWYIDNIRL